MNIDRFEVYKYFCGIKNEIQHTPDTLIVTHLCHGVHCNKCKYKGIHNECSTYYNILIPIQEIGQFNSQLKLTNPEYFI